VPFTGLAPRASQSTNIHGVFLLVTVPGYASLDALGYRRKLTKEHTRGRGKSMGKKSGAAGVRGDARRQSWYRAVRVFIAAPPAVLFSIPDMFHAGGMDSVSEFFTPIDRLAGLISATKGALVGDPLLILGTVLKKYADDLPDKVTNFGTFGYVLTMTSSGRYELAGTDTRGMPQTALRTTPGYDQPGMSTARRVSDRKSSYSATRQGRQSQLSQRYVMLR
jgi:hypothetical protein